MPQYGQTVSTESSSERDRMGTSRIGLFTRAPVGHAATHSPQVTQEDSPIGSFRSKAIRAVYPFPERTITSLPWMSSQALTQRSQRMQASWLTEMTGFEWSSPRPEAMGIPS